MLAKINDRCEHEAPYYCCGVQIGDSCQCCEDAALKHKRDPRRSYWRWPTFTWLHPANSIWGFRRNVYWRHDPWQTVIGVALYMGRRGVGVRWRTPQTPEGWTRKGT